MKGKIIIGVHKIQAELDSEDPAIEEACQKIIDDAAERIESAIVEAVCHQIRLLLPGITTECTGTWMEGEEEKEDEQ